MSPATAIIGHDDARDTLRKLYRSGGPHTLLLAGPDGVGRRPLAHWLSALVNCQADRSEDRPCGRCASCLAVAAGTHPDVRELAPSETTRSGRQRRRIEITIDRLVRRTGGDPEPLGPWLEQRPRFARRVGIVDRAESLNANAANAFLKMLEEPPPWALIVLIATGPDALLPTVASRCATVRLGAVDVRPFSGFDGHPAFRLGLPGPLVRARDDEEGFRAAASEAARLLDTLGGPLQAALGAADDLAKGLEGEQPVSALELLREGLRGLSPDRYARALDALERCERALAAYVSASLAVTALTLELRTIVRTGSG